MKKILSPEDRVVYKPESLDVSLIPEISCQEALRLAASYAKNEASSGEIYILGIHLVNERIDHEESCPKFDHGLVTKVKTSAQQVVAS